MASARKTFNPKNTKRDDSADYGEFLAAMLKGEVAATKLVETRLGNGKIKLEYDDPAGAGQAQVVASKSVSASPPPASTPTDPASPVPSPGADADR
jgi:hypothetical protein